jgi:sugar lactone lactonase YvrE
MAKGTGLGLMRNPPQHGAVWRIDLSKPPGSNVEPLTGGHRTPNGLGFGPEGQIYVTDNQGEYTPANELNRVERGRFYGFYHRTDNGGFPTPFQEEAERMNPGHAVTEAAVWLPQDEIANSPSEPVLVPAHWPYAGQMLVGDVKYGGVNRVFLEQVDGVWQGAALRFTQGLEAGINRLTFGPAGTLYVGGIGGVHASTWNWVDPQGRRTFQGLQRLRPNGRQVFDLDHISAVRGGFRITFTKAVDRAWLRSTDNYTVRQWTYRATPQYGGPKIDEHSLTVQAAHAAQDGKSVELKILGLKQGYCVYFLIDPLSTDGEEIWSAEAWYTLRKLLE